jgi:ribosomal protein L11 methyltransferase
MIKNLENWLALEITVETKAIEAVEFALNELDSLGTEINNLGKKQAETVCVVGYFNEQPTAEFVKSQINNALRIYEFDTDSIKEVSWRKIENKDWLEEWKKHWKPTKTGKFIIAPTWSTVETNELAKQNREIVIRIDPEMAFGTGTHETTRLCLQAIEENYTPEMSFLDVGTGTGILAIAAVKLQISDSEFNRPSQNSKPQTQKRILACDTDEDSIIIARKNAELNNVADEIDFYVGSIDENTDEFDFVCANLTADVILPILSLLVEKAKRKIVLSGILKQQENSITEKLNELETTNFKIQSDGEWISVLIEKRQS